MSGASSSSSSRATEDSSDDEQQSGEAKAHAAVVASYFRNSDVVRGRTKQRSLLSCGIISKHEAQLAEGKYEAMEVLHAAWSVVIQNLPMASPFLEYVDQGLVCTLMCVSRGMRSTVMGLCAGRLGVFLSSCSHERGFEVRRTLTSFARWLPQHGHLLDQLYVSDIQDESDAAQRPIVGVVLARAMWEAGSKLQLRTLGCGSCDLLLPQAAALQSIRTGLTELDFTIKTGCISSSEAQPMVQALRQLTALQSLTLDRAEDTGLRNVNKLLPGLSGLTKLTYLSAGFNRRAELSSYLPASLVVLELGSVALISDPDSEDEDIEDDNDWERRLYLPRNAKGTGAPFSLHLSHLAAVTWLDFLWDFELDEWEALRLGDELPPNTKELSAAVRHGAALQVLHPLTQLTRLDLQYSNVQASQLQALTALRNLKKLSLNDPDLHWGEPIPMDNPDDYCEAWPMLPLSKLALGGFVTPLVLQNVAKTTQITSLRLHCEEDSVGTLSGLAAALQPLKLLSVLDVRWNGLDYVGVADAVSSCFKALGGLPQLSGVTLLDMPLQRDAVGDLSNLQQLRTLWLQSDYYVDDYCVDSIASNLTGLRDLTLRGNRDVTDAALATVVKHMHQLAFLDLCHTGVSKAGVALLRQLPLRQLKLCGIKDLVDEVDESVCPRYCRYCSASCPYKDGV